jgi:Secretion system C-terminal sorting domain
MTLSCVYFKKTTNFVALNMVNHLPTDFMQQKLRLVCVLLLGTFFTANAQTARCVRDSSILKKPDTELLAPAPYTPESPVFNLNVACISTAYSQSVTVRVPESFTTSGITLPLTNASIATTGAVTNLPKGLSYVCDPPNCVFLAKTLGCILISGTPTAENAPGTFDLGINAKVQTALAPIDITFPGTLAPGSHYYLILRSLANCTSGTNNLSDRVASVRNMPNPFTGRTTIEVEAITGGDYVFSVFDLLGRTIEQRQLRLDTGNNRFDFEASKLPRGAYRYAISNAEGVVTRMMIVE